MGHMHAHHLSLATSPADGCSPAASGDWYQYNLTFPTRQPTAQAARELLQALTKAEADGLLRCWWFIRKQPWRLRYQPARDTHAAQVGAALDALTHAGLLTRWTTGIYEPETVAFGGELAMRIAHQLFHTDSSYLLARAAAPDDAPLGLRETTVLLCSTMMRGARLDWYEQGDVWQHVAVLRHASPADAHDRLASAMHQLMTASAPALTCEHGPLAGNSGWVSAFEIAGRGLAELADIGQLGRGLRAVLAHHVIFHTNRAGLPVSEQAALAALAIGDIFGTSPATPAAISRHATVSSIPASADSAPSASDLRGQLAARLLDRGMVRTPEIVTAFLATPRHLFLPGYPPRQAYSDQPVYTKQDPSGTNISAATQPSIVAMMLEQLSPQPGQRILEIGTGTGYNAALLASITGPRGHVTTIDLDPDLVTTAQEHLTAAGVSNAAVVLGDGALGHPASAPYDRIIATAGAHEVPDSWLDQLAPAGRLVVPLRLRGASSRSITFERGPDGWTSPRSELAVFIPLRGIGDDTRRTIHLTPGGEITLQAHHDNIVLQTQLIGVLDCPRAEEWTGVLFPPEVPYEWMDLWLCLRLPNPLMRMNTQPTSAVTGTVTPMFSWGSMATVSGSTLAYLTTRPTTPATGHPQLYEVGVISHGPQRNQLAAQVATEIRLWDHHYRTRPVSIALPHNPPAADPDVGVFVLRCASRPISITWQ